MNNLEQYYLYGVSSIFQYLDIVMSYPQLVLTGILSFVFLSIIAYYLSGHGTKGDGMPHLSKDQREIVEDVITEGFEVAVLLGKMSRSRSRYWYNRLGKELELPGLLLPRRMFKKLHPFRTSKLKERIKATLANGEHKPVPLPKEQPKQQKELKRKTSGNPKLDAIFSR